jgi:hypothetical protein
VADPSSPARADRPLVPWLALIGPAFLALSTVFAWTMEMFSPGPSPIYATELSIPFLVSTRFFMTRAPSLAQVLAVLAIGAAILILVETRWADIVRRLLGLCALIGTGLFAWRLEQSIESVLPSRGMDRAGLLTFLGSGFYLGVIGAFLLIVLPGTRRLRPVAAPADARLGSGDAG